MNFELTLNRIEFRSFFFRYPIIDIVT